MPHSTTMKTSPKSKPRHATVASGVPAFREGHRTLPSRKEGTAALCAQVHETWRQSALPPPLPSTPPLPLPSERTLPREIKGKAPPPKCPPFQAVPRS